MRAAQAAVKAAEAEMLVAQASAAVASAQLAEAEALLDEREQSGRAGTAAALGGAAGSLPLILATGAPSSVQKAALLCQQSGSGDGTQLLIRKPVQCDVVTRGFCSASPCSARRSGMAVQGHLHDAIAGAASGLVPGFPCRAPSLLQVDQEQHTWRSNDTRRALMQACRRRRYQCGGMLAGRGGHLVRAVWRDLPVCRARRGRQPAAEGRRRGRVWPGALCGSIWAGQAGGAGSPRGCCSGHGMP